MPKKKEKIICEDCGAILDKEDKECKECGARFIEGNREEEEEKEEIITRMVKRCPKCKSIRLEGQEKCIKCEKDFKTKMDKKENLEITSLILSLIPILIYLLTGFSYNWGSALVIIAFYSVSIGLFIYIKSIKDAISALKISKNSYVAIISLFITGSFIIYLVLRFFFPFLWV